MFMKRTVLPVQLQEKLTKLIKVLTALKKASFISLLVTNVVNNTRQLKVFAIGGIITDLTLVIMHKAYHACKNYFTNIFVVVNIVVFLTMSQ